MRSEEGGEIKRHYRLFRRLKRSARSFSLHASWLLACSCPEVLARHFLSREHSLQASVLQIKIWTEYTRSAILEKQYVRRINRVPKHPLAEVFGFPINNFSTDAERYVQYH